MVPAEDEGKPHQPGEPELPPEQIQAKIEKDRALWYTHADGLKTAALEAVRIAKARDIDALVQGRRLVVDQGVRSLSPRILVSRRPRSGAQAIRTAKSPTIRRRLRHAARKK